MVKTGSKRALRGSGGVGILVRSKWATTTLDSSFEGILWIKFEDNLSKCVCVCYLPPSTSSRVDNSEEFFGNPNYPLQGDMTFLHLW